MNSSRLGRQYGKLAARERFRLVVAAEARADASEVDLLLRTCPRFTYHGRDLAFEQRFQTSYWFTLVFLGSLEAISGRLAVVDAAQYAGRALFSMAADHADYKAFEITGESQPSIRRVVRRDRGTFRKMFREIQETLLVEGATLAHAFVELCRATSSSSTPASSSALSVRRDESCSTSFSPSDPMRRRYRAPRRSS